MTGIKILDKNSRAPRRRPKLWECFSSVGIFPSDIKDSFSNAYYAIVQSSTVEKILTQEIKDKFQDEGFQILPPTEFNAMRSIVVRHLDKVVDEYNEEEIIDTINTKNDWAEAEYVYKIASSGRLLKIRFKSTNMPNRALKDGLFFLDQYIPVKQIERETYVKITPCYNCFQYDHKTRECPKDHQDVCAFCAQSGHRQNTCRETTPKCLNCDGLH